MVAVKEIAWLAGILEGEGCFQYRKTPVIKVKMTDLDTIERVSILLECKSIHHEKRILGCKQAYVATVSGYKAAQWMMTVLPIMGLRRSDKIIECLAKWKNSPLRGSPYIYPCGHLRTEENTRIHGRYKTCKSCNHKKRNYI